MEKKEAREISWRDIVVDDGCLSGGGTPASGSLPRRKWVTSRRSPLASRGVSQDSTADS